MNILGYAHWFMSICISQLKDHYISVYQARYDTSFVERYPDTLTIKYHSKFNNINLTHDMIFNREDTYTGDEQVEVLSI